MIDYWLLIINYWSLSGSAEVWGVGSDFLSRRCNFRPPEAEIRQALDGQDALALFLWARKRCLQKGLFCRFRKWGFQIGLFCGFRKWWVHIGRSSFYRILKIQTLNWKQTVPVKTHHIEPGVGQNPIEVRALCRVMDQEFAGEFASLVCDWGEVLHRKPHFSWQDVSAGRLRGDTEEGRSTAARRECVRYLALFCSCPE